MTQSLKVSSLFNFATVGGSSMLRTLCFEASLMRLTDWVWHWQRNSIPFHQNWWSLMFLPQYLRTLTISGFSLDFHQLITKVNKRNGNRLPRQELKKKSAMPFDSWLLGKHIGEFYTVFICLLSIFSFLWSHTISKSWANTMLHAQQEKASSVTCLCFKVCLGGTLVVDEVS